MVGVPPQDRHLFLWSHNRLSRQVTISNLTSCFKSLVIDSRKHAEFSVDVPMGPLQMRKFSASYAAKHGQIESRVLKVM